MLDKTNLARYLARCLASEADFAEIYEEEEVSEEEAAAGLSALFG